MTAPLEVTPFQLTTADRWQLPLKRTVNRERLDHSLRPIAIIPGYGMNAFILGYHPTGRSFEGYLADRGFEVWSADLRGQGESSHPNGRGDYGIEELATRDLPEVLDFIARTTESRHRALHTIGCSLGGSLLFAHLATCGADHRVASVAALGAPLRWERVHPVMRLVFGSRRLAGLLPTRGNRRMASLVFPLALRAPRTLQMYLHTEITNTSQPEILLQTVADTSRRLNQEIAGWIQQKDLHLDGRNVTRAMRRVDLPLLCVVANADGIVPVESALSAYEEWGSRDKSVLVVGDTHRRFAHADLFISDYSEELVFQPIADWFATR